MDGLIEQNQWWPPFVVPVATGLLALFGSWFGAKLGKDTEHKQWLRNERVKAYSAFLEANENVQQTLFKYRSERKTPEEVYKAIDGLSMQRLLLLSSAKTKDACFAFGDAMVGFGRAFDEIPPNVDLIPVATEAYDAALEKLRASMADDTGAAMSSFRTN